MKIKLIFNDWIKDGKSVYDAFKGAELSSNKFHGGSTFNGEIFLDDEDEKELITAMEEGYMPTFLTMQLFPKESPEIMAQRLKEKK